MASKILQQRKCKITARPSSKGLSKQVSQQPIIRLATILGIQQTLEKNRAGLRKLPGTELRNHATGELIYTPPQDGIEVERLMANLINFINDDGLSSLDPLIKLAIIHHQFESIHPFYDGNGRTGRIINILYLVVNGLLDIPVLYLSRYFIQDKAEYYRQLQAVREHDSWEPWLIYMLRGIEITAKQTLQLVQAIKVVMQDFKHRIRSDLPKVYSQDLLNNLFKHPYTKIDIVMHDLQVSRITATKYLEQLVQNGYLDKHKLGRSNYYVNMALFSLLTKGA